MMPDNEQALRSQLSAPDSDDGPAGSPHQDTSQVGSGANETKEVHTIQVAQIEPYDTETAMNQLLEGLPKPNVSKDKAGDLHHMPEGTRSSGWQNCFKVVEKHDKDLCQAYREQIDTLLVFAGLFSAVVTAFSVESYQWLQDDPAETSAVLLRDMLVVIAQTSNRTLESPPFRASRLSDDVIVRINIFWFVSLCLSLSAALVGILCKQWVREYERDVGMSPEKALTVRHVRFQGLEYWKVGTIITSVPIILQLALALFILGIVDLLWRLHTTVAICVTAVAVLTLAFYLSTTFLPLIQYTYICIRCCFAIGITDKYCRLRAFAAPQCAFKSAQAWIVIRIAQPVVEYCIKTYARCFAYYVPPSVHPLETPRADSWVRFDINWTRRREFLYCGPRAAYEALSWAARYLDEAGLGTWIWHCVWAHRQGSLGLLDDIQFALKDIGCVAKAYPRLFRLDSSFPAYIRAQSLVFQCSLRADLPTDSIIEQLLRISFAVGVNSPWTREALNAVVALYDERPLHISDDMAMGLFDLAEFQSREQWETELQIVTEWYEPHFPFLQIARLLSRGSRLRGRLLPAMCALGVPWLGVQSRDTVKLMARNLLAVTIDYYVELGYGHQQLLEAPGVLLVGRFARITFIIWPDLRTWWTNRPRNERVLSALLSIWSSRDENAAPAGETPAADPACVQAITSERLLSNVHDDVRLTVHETNSTAAGIALNAVAEPFEGSTSSV